MKKFIFMVVALSFSAMVWGQSVSDQSFLDGRRSFIGEPLGTVAQDAGTPRPNAAPRAGDSVSSVRTDLDNHRNPEATGSAQSIAEQNEINVGDDSATGQLTRLRFLEYLHGLSALSGPTPGPSDGFIPQYVQGSTDQVIIIGYDGKQIENLVIPKEISRPDPRDSKNVIAGTVVGIGPGALANLGLKGSITFEDNDAFTTIGEEAFSNNYIESVTFLPSTTRIGNGAFSNNLLVTVTIPPNLTDTKPDPFTIEYSAFAGNKLTSVTFPLNPANIRTIDHHAFATNQLATIVVPNSVEKILNSAFENNKLTTVTLTDNIVELGDSAFAVNLLKEIKIPNNASLTELKYGVFSHNSLTKITFPADKITKIGDSAFSDNLLPTVTIPQSVVEIGKGAFCVNLLKEVLFIGDTTRQFATSSGETEGASIARIGPGAFSYNQLPAISIPNSVTELGDQAFMGNQLTRVIIGSGVETIGNYAFQANKLVSITIPNTVRTIGEGAFIGDAARTLAIGGKPPTSISVQNKLVSVTLGEAVEKIGKLAFGNNALTTVSIPNSVTEIGEAAFQSNLLTTIQLGTGVKNIRKNAFNNNKLAIVSISDSCEILEVDAFTKNAMDRVIIPAKVYSDSKMFPRPLPSSIPAGSAQRDVREGLIKIAFDPSIRLIYL